MLSTGLSWAAYSYLDYSKKHLLYERPGGEERYAAHLIAHITCTIADGDPR